jgi:hypothetical protein
LSEELARLAVAFVERQPLNPHTIGDNSLVHVKGNLPLGTVEHLVGNASRPTPPSVVGPAFGEKQFPVKQAVKGPCRVA